MRHITALVLKGANILAGASDGTFWVFQENGVWTEYDSLPQPDAEEKPYRNGVRVIFSSGRGRFEGVIDGEPYQLNDVWLVNLRGMPAEYGMSAVMGANIGALDIIS